MQTFAHLEHAQPLGALGLREGFGVFDLLITKIELLAEFGGHTFIIRW